MIAALGRSLARIAVITAASVGVAVGYVHWFAPHLPWKHVKPPAEVSIDLEKFRALLAQGAAILDARTADEFNEGHLAVNDPSVLLNVPEKDAWDQMGRLQPLLTYPIVVYCSSIRCEAAEQVYFALQKNEFGPLYIYYPGWEVLQKHFPAATGPEKWHGLSPGTMLPPEESPAEAPPGTENGGPAETPAPEPGSGG